MASNRKEHKEQTLKEPTLLVMASTRLAGKELGKELRDSYIVVLKAAKARGTPQHRNDRFLPC